jgi:hypothetical protein
LTLAEDTLILFRLITPFQLSDYLAGQLAAKDVFFSLFFFHAIDFLLLPPLFMLPLLSCADAACRFSRPDSRAIDYDYAFSDCRRRGRQASILSFQ